MSLQGEIGSFHNMIDVKINNAFGLVFVRSLIDTASPHPDVNERMKTDFHINDIGNKQC